MQNPGDAKSAPNPDDTVLHSVGGHRGCRQSAARDVSSRPRRRMDSVECMRQLVDGMHASGDGAARLLLPVGSMRQLADCCAQIPSGRADAASDAVHPSSATTARRWRKLLSTDELRRVLAGQGLCRRYLDVAEAIVAVADRLWFVVCAAPDRPVPTALAGCAARDLTCSGVISAQAEVRCECRRVTAGWVRACPRRRLGNTRGRRIPHIGKQSSDRPDFT